MRDRWLTGVAAVLLWSVTQACTGGGVGSLVTETDSAGVLVVENGTGTFDHTPQWELVVPPEVSIGALEGSPAEQFNEILGAFTLSDGRMVVADGGAAGSREIRIFDVSGQHLRTVGGRGEGPGEFGFLASLDVLPGDTLVASDWPIGTLSRFSPEGEFVRLDRVGAYYPGLTGRVLPDGSLLTEIYGRGSYGNELEGWAAFGTEDVFRPEGHLLRVSEGGDQVDTLARIQGEEWFRNGQVRVNLVLRPLPFARTTVIRWSDTHILMGDNESSQLMLMDYAGQVTGMVRWTGARIRPNAADRDWFAQNLMDRASPSREADFRRWLAAVPYPETFPAFMDARVGPNGSIWVQEPEHADAEGGRWLVFDPEGRARATVSTPPGLTLHFIGEGHVLATWTDELQLPYLRRYVINRRPEG